MNLEQFDKTYANKKGADKIEINCDHPEHPDILPRILGKTPARRNILKNGGLNFICRDCCMKFDNPMNKIGGGRQNDEEIPVECPKCLKIRIMKKACYYGKMEEPYQQVCGSCVQKGKEISEEQREKISKKLKGVEKSEEFKQKIRDYMKNNPEGIERGKTNLIPGFAGGWNTGMIMSEEHRAKQSAGLIGKPKSLEHRLHISQGRKKMLKEVGGFTNDHRKNISKATIKQYQDGFQPETHHLHGSHYSIKMNKNISYKSSYEKRAFIILDTDPNVKEYYYESISMEYLHPIENSTKQYLIDLTVIMMDNTMKIIEVKPKKCSKQLINVAKQKRAEEIATKNGQIYELWTEDKLFDNELEMRKFIGWLKTQTGELT